MPPSQQVRGGEDGVAGERVGVGVFTALDRFSMRPFDARVHARTVGVRARLLNMRRRPAVLALVAFAAAAACSAGHPGLTDQEQTSLLDSCVAASAAGQSEFPTSACDQIVAVIADDAKALGCSYETARQLLTAAVANDKPAVRRLERDC